MGEDKNIKSLATPAQKHGWEILIKKKMRRICIPFYKISQHNFVFSGLFHALTYTLEDVSVNIFF
jgi:hypothetical protein